jgi:catechol 2,3-dioxygenase-like lactoylglutathione lyase family enzyme
MVKSLDHLNMSVRDLAESVEWYRRVFGFEVVEKGVLEGGRPWAIVRSGDAMLCLYEHPERKTPDPDEHGHHAPSHFGLRIEDRAKWEETVERERVAVGYGGAVRWPHSTAWYVEDPTGYEIEVALWDDDVVRFDAPRKGR